MFTGQGLEEVYSSRHLCFERTAMLTGPASGRGKPGGAGVRLALGSFTLALKERVDTPELWHDDNPYVAYQAT